MQTPLRTPLVLLPTPLHRLDRLSEELSIDLWIKRDDLTGLALGGNKGRKLEYLMTDVLASGAQVVVTCGSLQSNFVRQLGAACAMFGIRCAAAVMDLPYDKAVGKPKSKGIGQEGGNALLDKLFGVELRLVPDDDWEVLYDAAEDLAKRLEREGLRVYRIPVGGSSPLGGYGFYAAAKEVQRQAPDFDYVVTASSSGSTQAGLAHGFRGASTQVVGIACDTEPDLVSEVERVSHGLEAAFAFPAMHRDEFDLRHGFAGEAYGIPSKEGDSAIEKMAKKEGIVLDPIYSGKALAGLCALAELGELEGRVLFWHTGGVPALFA